MGTIIGAVIIGGAAVYAAESVEAADFYKTADPNMQKVYKYGAAGGAALIGGIAAHMLLGMGHKKA